jgi:hypothetical protein
VPIFPGASIEQQLKCIAAVLGSPKREDFPKSLDVPLYALEPIVPGVGLAASVPKLDAPAIEMLSAMLMYNPDMRSSAGQCLARYFILTQMPTLKS